MPCIHDETTNGLIDMALERLDLLIEWAERDAAHAAEHDAPGVARNDRWRAQQLRKARRRIEETRR